MANPLVKHIEISKYEKLNSLEGVVNLTTVYACGKRWVTTYAKEMPAPAKPWKPTARKCKKCTEYECVDSLGF